MSTRRIAFIGAGQMGGALLRGFLGAGLVRPENIYISDVDFERLKKLQEDFGVNPVDSNAEAAKSADIVILSVKPQQVLEVVEEISPHLNEEKVVITIAAGMTTEKILSRARKAIRLVRVMPNAPALIGMSASAVSPSEFADRDAVDETIALFKSVGDAIELPEEDQNKVTAISGSGPAYLYYMVEALRDAAIRFGLDPQVATRLVVKTIAGSAAMLSETGRSPEELRKMVTSPGGTTEAAIRAFEAADFKNVVWEAVEAALWRAEELAK